jgi:hypothetical protein
MNNAARPPGLRCDPIRGRLTFEKTKRADNLPSKVLRRQRQNVRYKKNSQIQVVDDTRTRLRSSAFPVPAIGEALFKRATDKSVLSPQVFDQRQHQSQCMFGDRAGVASGGGENRQAQALGRS